jgi:hypothetical protein
VWLYGNYQPFGHAGSDIGCEVGTPVRAARSGTVVWSDWDVNLPGNDSWGPGGYFDRWGFYKRFGGRIIVVQHAPGDLDAYAHLSQFKVSRGQFINEGDLIALSGDSSGGQDGVLGPHLHTERIVDLSYSTGNGKIYGRIDPSTVWGGLASQGTITQEEDVANTQTELQAAVQAVLRDNDLTRDGRSVTEALTQLLDSTDIIGARDLKQLEELAALKELLGQLVKSTAANQSTYYLKGDKAPEVYALDVASGKLRHVLLAEFDIVTSIGIFKTVAQAKVDALLKGY